MLVEFWLHACVLHANKKSNRNESFFCLKLMLVQNTRLRSTHTHYTLTVQKLVVCCVSQL